MAKIPIEDIIIGLSHGDYLWILIPIFFIGILTDKYQEESTTSIGNAISNGALIIFTGFSWLQIISARTSYYDLIASQFVFSILVISYGFAIIISGFRKGIFARVYGRIRVITFMLIFFTMMIYVPILYNFVSVLIFVLLFPFYYALITELVKVMPSATNTNTRINKIKSNNKSSIKKSSNKNHEGKNEEKKNTIFFINKEKIKEYLE